MNNLDEAKLDAPETSGKEVYSLTHHPDVRMRNLVPFTSETARLASLKRNEVSPERKITRAIAQHYPADTVVQLFDEAFQLARGRNSPKAFVEALSLLMGYLVGDPIKRQVTATTTLEDMIGRYLRPAGEAAGTPPPGGEGGDL